MKKSILKEKSFKFAVRIVLLYKYLREEKKENETIYWLELLNITEYISKKEFDSINTDAIELIKIITAS